MKILSYIMAVLGVGFCLSGIFIAITGEPPDGLIFCLVGLTLNLIAMNMGSNEN